MHRDEMFGGWPHVVEAQQFSANWISEVLFPMAADMQTVAGTGGCKLLARKRMMSFFYEASTRTRCSFQMAMDLMGGKTPFATENAKEFSSAAKGESLEDTFNVLAQYSPDVIVLRHSQKGAAATAAKILTDFANGKEGNKRIALINAGDGRGQHPTQALLDLYTVYQRLGMVGGLSYAMVGDLANGRTVRSLSYLIAKYPPPQAKIYFVAPRGSEIGDDIKEHLRKHEVTFYESTDLREVAPKVDVIYQTRTQKERGGNIDRNDHSLGYFTVDREIMSLLKPQGVVLHPLPRNEEITTDVDADPRAVYLKEQIRSGLIIRMALLKIVLAPAV